MLDAVQKLAIDSAVLRASETFRLSSVDIVGYRDVVMCVLMLKFLTDIQAGAQSIHYDADTPDFANLVRQLVVPPEANFRNLFLQRNEQEGELGNGGRLNAAVYALASKNPGKLDGIQGINFSAKHLGERKSRDQALAKLLDAVGNDPALNFLPKNSSEQAQVFAAAAYACEALLNSAAATIGKRGAEFFTPPALSRLLAALLEPRSGETVMDPCCGSGLLLAICSQHARQLGEGKGCELYGQEINGDTLSLARTSMVMLGEPRCTFAWGDVLRDPKFQTAEGRLRTFDVVVSSPPFNSAGWPRDVAASDPAQRFWRGLPPASSANYAFISHMVESMASNGRMAVVVTMGALSRGSAEAHIRQKLIEENLVDAVIALPAKLYPNTGIPAAILILRRNKQQKQVLFIDGGEFFQPGKTQNTLGPADVERIVAAYRDPASKQTYLRAVQLEEIASNDFSLQVTRYVQAAPQLEEVDLVALREERASLQFQLAELEANLAQIRGEVGDG